MAPPATGAVPMPPPVRGGRSLDAVRPGRSLGPVRAPVPPVEAPGAHRARHGALRGRTRPSRHDRPPPARRAALVRAARPEAQRTAAARTASAGSRTRKRPHASGAGGRAGYSSLVGVGAAAWAQGRFSADARTPRGSSTPRPGGVLQLVARAGAEVGRYADEQGRTDASRRRSLVAMPDASAHSCAAENALTRGLTPGIGGSELEPGVGDGRARDGQASARR